MEVTGKIKVLNNTMQFGSNGFKKREVIITTEEQYPQHLLIEFVQDKCDLLNNFAVGQEVKININLRGREWINPEGVAKYFNSFQGWKIENLNNSGSTSNSIPDPIDTNFLDEDDETDLPF